VVCHNGVYNHCLSAWPGRRGKPRRRNENVSRKRPSGGTFPWGRQVSGHALVKRRTMAKQACVDCPARVVLTGYLQAHVAQTGLERRPNSIEIESPPLSTRCHGSRWTQPNTGMPRQVGGPPTRAGCNRYSNTPSGTPSNRRSGQHLRPFSPDPLRGAKDLAWVSSDTAKIQVSFRGI
jgi:hypothetical protein